MPLLAALLVGGYIKSFKGFGVELEASLSEPISTVELTATEAMEELAGDEKQSLSYLRSISKSNLKKISRLIFYEGRRDYYRSHAIYRYLEQLVGLKYIEIRSASGRFVGLIPIQELKCERRSNGEHVTDFIENLEQSSISLRYQQVLISKSVHKRTELIESLKIMRRSNIRKLVVLDENETFVGVLLIKAVEKKIVEEVLAATKNT